MIRSVLVRVLFVAIGAAATGAVISWRAQTEPAPSAPGGPPAHLGSGGAFRSVGERAESAGQANIERRLTQVEAALANAATERQQLTDQLAAIAAQLAASHGGSHETATAQATANAPLLAPEPPTNAVANVPSVGDRKESAMERALTAAGLDATTVAEIKRRHDDSTMAEIYLRDRAAREQWLDSPRFSAEMAAITAQRKPLRDEIGNDDAYDRYLFALGEANRVRVDDVLLESPAAQAGLQTGDLIVRYGETRLFTPSELVNETRSGTAGEAVQVEIIRDGQRLEVEVPRGPLGLRIAATQGQPGVS